MQTTQRNHVRNAGTVPAPTGWTVRRGRGSWIGMAMALLVGVSASAALWDEDDSQSSRALYNEGTQKLREGKLRDAELALQTAVARNRETVQPVALYNLGQVRFQQGAEVLKDAPDGTAANAHGAMADAAADSALQAADEALAGYDLNAIVAAYMHGRGARKQLKTAMEAVKQALESYGAVISRWQRASGDFKSAQELRGKYDDAQFNAEVVDRNLAKLIDRQEALQMCMQSMGEKKSDLKKKMKQLKDLLPESLKQQCEGDEEDEDADEPKEPKPGEKEAKPRDGRKLWLTPEEAARLLEAMMLDGNRKLPMGFKESRPPQDRSGRVW